MNLLDGISPHPDSLLGPLHPDVAAAIQTVSEPNLWKRSEAYHQLPPNAQGWAKWLANMTAQGQALLERRRP